jgi:hypothetical protein
LVGTAEGVCHESGQHGCRGQVATISFGVAFVVIEGFSIRDTGALRWLLRLDKEFSIGNAASPSNRLVDIFGGELGGVTQLISCCGQDIASFEIGERGMTLTFANEKIIQMVWDDNDFSCAELNVIEVSEENSTLIGSINLPDDIAAAAASNI